MAASKTVNGKKPVPPRRTERMKPGRRRSIQQVLDIQEAVYQASMAEEVRPADLAALARAFDVLEDRKRILRGKPLPGSLKPKTKKAPRQSLHAMPIDMEPMPDEKAQDMQETQAGIDEAGKESLLAGEP